MAKTHQQVLIEICPDCNTVHRYSVVSGILREVGRAEIVCNGVKGYLPHGEKNPQPVPIVCDHVIAPNAENTFTIKRWNFRQRREFYKQSRTFRVNPSADSLDPDIMVWVILNGVVDSPFPLKTKEDVDAVDVDGAVLEALNTAIIDLNTPPLAQSSVLRRQSTPRIPA